MDDLDAGHFWHLELGDQQVDRALALVFNRELHDEIYGRHAAREALYLSNVAEVK